MTSATRRGVAIALWIIWASLLGWSLIRPGPGAVWLRVASSIMLVTAAWLFAALKCSGGIGDGVGWIALGMTFGCLGDAWAIVPADRLPVHRLIPAMVLFGIGHVAYIVGFLSARRCRPIDPRTVLASCILWIFAAALAWQWSINLSSAPPLLRWSALAYSILLGSTTAAATILAATRRGFLAVAVGSVLFLISDFVLATQSFRGSFPHATEICWATYGPGQMLIVFGMAWATGAMQRPAPASAPAILPGPGVPDAANR